jgi:Uma2 family endonuclease
MSLEEFRRLPEKPKAEWVDGVAVIHTVPPVWDHSSLQLSMGVWFRSHLPDLLSGTEAEVWLPANRLRVPDVAVTERSPAGERIDATVDPPLIVVEVLSPTTRGEDLVRKAPEYAAAGIAQYWVVDPDEPSIEVNQLVDGGWLPVAKVTAELPTATFAVPGHGDVELDFREIFRR